MAGALFALLVHPSNSAGFARNIQRKARQNMRNVKSRIAPAVRKASRRKRVNAVGCEMIQRHSIRPFQKLGERNESRSRIHSTRNLAQSVAGWSTSGRAVSSATCLAARPLPDMEASNHSTTREKLLQLSTATTTPIRPQPSPPVPGGSPVPKPPPVPPKTTPGPSPLPNPDPANHPAPKSPVPIDEPQRQR